MAICNWSQLQFHHLPPGFFSCFHSLRVLKLGSSNLQTFPLEILQLRNLKVLNLWIAKISRCIPYYIGNLTSLTKLDLNNNVFSGGLPSTISNLTSLRIMRCVNCSLSGEIKALANLTISQITISQASFLYVWCIIFSIFYLLLINVFSETLYRADLFWWQSKTQ